MVHHRPSDKKESFFPLFIIIICPYILFLSFLGFLLADHTWFSLLSFLFCSFCFFFYFFCMFSCFVLCWPTPTPTQGENIGLKRRREAYLLFLSCWPNEKRQWEFFFWRIGFLVFCYKNETHRGKKGGWFFAAALFCFKRKKWFWVLYWMRETNCAQRVSAWMSSGFFCTEKWSLGGLSWSTAEHLANLEGWICNGCNWSKVEMNVQAAAAFLC
jgi:hypothetical protein